MVNGYRSESELENERGRDADSALGDLLEAMRRLSASGRAPDCTIEVRKRLDWTRRSFGPFGLGGRQVVPDEWVAAGVAAWYLGAFVTHTGSVDGEDRPVTRHFALGADGRFYRNEADEHGLDPGGVGRRREFRGSLLSAEDMKRWAPELLGLIRTALS